MDRSPTLAWRDVLLPAALLALGTVELATLDADGRWYGVGLEMISAGLLVFRRWRPLVFATSAALVLLAMPWVGPRLDDAAVPILFAAVALYSLGRWIADLRGVAGVVLTFAAFSFDYLTVDSRVHDFTDVMFLLVICVPPYVVGRITRKLADRAELLERNQELVRREAIRVERDRIARELHDVIAHSVSAMVVQTAAAQDLVRGDPERAERVLGDVAATGRRALAETGRLLHVIRDERDELGLDPAPGLREVPTLVEAFKKSGLDVDLVVDESLPALPAGIDVSAYRIVQEALTNALKHGVDRTASLRVAATPTALAIEASNPADGRSGGGNGLGLMGIGERVAMAGGRLSHGVADGQFRLSVTMPLVTRPS